MLDPRPIGTSLRDAPTIALYGYFGVGNIGNDATLAAMAHNLQIRLPNARLVSICPNHSRPEDLFGLDSIPVDPLPAPGFWRLRPAFVRSWCNFTAHLLSEWPRIREAARRLDGVDQLVIAGTGALDDFGTAPWQLPLDVYRWCAAARRAQVPVSLVSVGAGPNTNRISHRLFTRVSESAAYCSFRDEYSKQYMESTSIVRADTQVYPDLALRLPSKMLPTAAAVQWPPRTIGLGVMNYRGWNESPERSAEIKATYIDKMVRILLWLVQQEYRVRLLIGDRAGDLPIAQQLVSAVEAHLGRLPDDQVVCRTLESLSELLEEIGSVDMVVATRFHNVVLSLLSERPTISIGYHVKNRAVMSQFGLERFCQDVESLDFSLFCKQFEEMTSLGCLQTTIAESKRACQTRLDQQFDMLAAKMSAEGAATDG